MTRVVGARTCHLSSPAVGALGCKRHVQPTSAGQVGDSVADAGRHRRYMASHSPRRTASRSGRAAQSPSRARPTAVARVADYRNEAWQVRCKGCRRTFVNDHPVRSYLCRGLPSRCPVRSLQHQTNAASTNRSPAGTVILEPSSLRLTPEAAHDPLRRRSRQSCW
jgi:hypothetical protein